MNVKLQKWSFVLGMVITSLYLNSCGEPEETNKTNHSANVPSKPKFRLKTENGLKTQRYGEDLRLTTQVLDTAITGQQVTVWVATDSIGSFPLDQRLTVPAENLEMGLNTIIVKLDGGYRKSIQVEVLSDLVPEKWTYQVVNTYKHDPEAYTQGLEFDFGVLYEGTGLRQGQSSLRKIDLQTGNVLHRIQLNHQDFGEGITVFKNAVYQLTWQNQRAYKYDKKSFKLMHTFTYPQGISEGWGLCHSDSLLIMSDGTNRIHFIHPETFEEIRSIDVYDTQQAVGQLNELEYIDGVIYANIYTTNNIVKIDPASGKVLAYIDMSGLLSPAEAQSGVDVLNGIAFNPITEKLYVTGKRWPKLFEVKFIPQS